LLLCISDWERHAAGAKAAINVHLDAGEAEVKCSPLPRHRSGGGYSLHHVQPTAAADVDEVVERHRLILWVPDACTSYCDRN